MMRHPSPHVRRQPRFGDAVHEALRLQPVRDELRDGDERQAVLEREPLELRRRFIVVPSSFEDLADHAGRIQAREPREIDGRFGVPDALEHAAVASAKRVDVPGASEVARARSRDRPRPEWSSRDRRR